jgi:predicted TIM-barrel fold metal-dependent hydrolase
LILTDDDSGIRRSALPLANVPANANANVCDCHAHVFGPFERFPLAADRLYTPPQATRLDHRAMLDTAGFARGVLVHAGANGWDHAAMLDALRSDPARLRGIAVPPTSISDQELADMHAAGVRGVRFTHIIGRTGKRNSGTLDLDDLKAFAPRLRTLGWHAQLWANCEVIAANASWLGTLGVPLVLDHLGVVEVAHGVASPDFQSVLELVREGLAWVKLTAFRNSRSGDARYADVRPFHDALVAANPQQLLWGSDWPFLGMTGENRPTVAHVLEVLCEWVQDAEVREQILSINPARLYGFNL